MLRSIRRVCDLLEGPQASRGGGTLQAIRGLATFLGGLQRSEGWLPSGGVADFGELCTILRSLQPSGCFARGGCNQGVTTFWGGRNIWGGFAAIQGIRDYIGGVAGIGGFWRHPRTPAKAAAGNSIQRGSWCHRGPVQHGTSPKIPGTPPTELGATFSAGLGALSSRLRRILGENDGKTGASSLLLFCVWHW